MSERFRTIVADPPWEIAGGRTMPAGGRRRRATTVPYSFMSLAEIKALPVAGLAADDAHLYLWTTRRVFREGVAAEVARAWGFEPFGEVIWGLRNPGLGRPATRNDHEPVLVARRGSLPFSGPEPMGVHFWRQLYAPGRGKVHSAKPDGFLDAVELWSPGPRLELFARRERLGWDCWGNEVTSTVTLPVREIPPGETRS